jgi:hypothetical protein
MHRVGVCVLCLCPALIGARAVAQALPPAVTTEMETEAEPAKPAKSQEGPRLERRIGDLLWAEGEAGIARVGLDTLSTGEILATEVLESSDSTFVWGVGAGLRALVVTVGVRFRYADFERWNLSTTNIEAGFRIPIRFIEPSFTFGAGYAKLGDFDFRNADELERAGVDIDGVDLRAGVGLDVYLPFQIYVGAKYTADLLIFARPAVSPRKFSNALDATAAQIYSQDGSSIGGGTSLTGVIGVHLF